MGCTMSAGVLDFELVRVRAVQSAFAAKALH